MRRMIWIGALGLAACGGAGEQDEPGHQDETPMSGGQGTGGGARPFDGSGGSSNPSGGAQGDGGTGTDGGHTSSGGQSSTGGETSTGGAPSSGGESSAGGGTSSGGMSEGVGGGDAMGACPHAGNVTYELNGPEAWPIEVVTNITEAMDDAVYYYNCYADLTKHITVNYNPGVPTAEANVDGWLSFGSNLAYMQTATALHEVAHTLGVGYYPWEELIQDGRWVGAAVDALMNSLPAEERDPELYSQRTYITCDSQHFWPYGLNQAAEYQSEWSVINHVRIVAAINEDKAAYLEQ